MASLERKKGTSLIFGREQAFIDMRAKRWLYVDTIKSVMTPFGTLARFHEEVHSLLSPKFTFLRSFRAGLGMSAYNKSKFLKYLEEALAETYAQLRVNGIRGTLTGVAFPVKEGYVVLSDVIQEVAKGSLIGTVVVGGVTYSAYLITYEAYSNE